MILRRGCIIILGVLFTFCTRHYVKQDESFAHYSLKDNQEPKRFSDSVLKFKKIVDAQTARVIAVSEGALTKEGDETTLGNFVCDALKFTAGKKNETADIVIINRGGLRSNIPMGEITVGHIFELMPFENEMIAVKLKGDVLLKFLPLLMDKKHPFYGLRVKMKDKQVASVTYGESALEKDKEYNIITSDYLYNGGDNFNFLKEGSEAKYLDMKIRDAIILYCEELARNNKKIVPYTDGRLEVSK
jgi:2',3'-cyclic-nucleotide 2'-phosphodiesterase (5'-nucleotidase family)